MKQPLAYVHPEAQIADNVVIEPFVTIDKNVVIEEGTRIGSNVTILEGAHIGKNCKIFPRGLLFLPFLRILNSRERRQSSRLVITRPSGSVRL